MKLLLLLLLPVCVFGFATFAELVEVLLGKNNGTEGESGKRFVLDREKLKKEWGVDPEMIKTRLHRLLKKSTVEQNQTETEEDPEEKEMGLNPANVTVTEEDDLFEVNEREGMSEYLYQGDIYFSEAELKAMEKNREKIQASIHHPRWPNNKLTYYFDTNIDEVTKTSVRTAHKLISSQTCVDFEEKKQQKEVVKVVKGTGCYSSIGYVFFSDNGQTLSLGNGCQVMGTAAHEFMHALGIFHEQSRSDRDDYVKFNKENVPENDVYNFRKIEADDNFLFTPYEYGSIMHYGARDFVKKDGVVALSAKPPNARYLHTMGGGQLSFYDVKMLNEYYECNAKCPVGTSAKCENGGYPNPRNCAVCNCPGGYGGALCNQRPAGCGAALTATPNWQTSQFVMGNAMDKSYRKVHSVCNSWITAPVGKQIEVVITKMDNPQCSYGCRFNGIEIKAEDKQRTNPRYCCTEFMNKPIVSTLNPTPIISFNRYLASTFAFKYRYVADLNKYLVNLKRFVSTTTPTTHRFHTSAEYEKQWLAKGFKFEVHLGKVVSTDLYNKNKAQIDKECGSLVLIHSFIKTYPVITSNPNYAQTLKNTAGWLEYEPIGYCSKTPSCGANKPLRAVVATDQKDSVYTTFENELNNLNRSARYKGTASKVVCYLF